jgi:hypothetical protein
MELRLVAHSIVSPAKPLAVGLLGFLLSLGAITAYFVGTLGLTKVPGPPPSLEDANQPASQRQEQLTREPSIPVAVQPGFVKNSGEVDPGSEKPNFQERFSPVELLLKPVEPVVVRPLAGRGPEESFEIPGSHVIISNAKLRKAPSAKSVTSIVLKAGSPVQVITVTNEWAQIKYESNGIFLEGYVRARELRAIQ